MFLLLIGVFVLLGCSSNKKQEPISKSGIPVINLSEDVSTVPSLLLSEVAEKLEIVPLEMTDESVLSDITEMQVTDHNIWIDHGREFYIYRFSRSGKFLNKIGSIGQGPGEYTNYSTFLVDEDKKEVYIIANTNGVLAYDFEGNFKRKIVDIQMILQLFASPSQAHPPPSLPRFLQSLPLFPAPLRAEAEMPPPRSCGSACFPSR